MRRPAVALVAVALLLSALPAVAGPEDRLDGAERQLEDTAQRLADAREAYEATRERLARLRSELGAVEQRLAEARREEWRARQRWRRRDRRVERAAHQLRARHRELSVRVTDAYQRGVSDAGRVWLSVFSSAQTPHDVALADRATRRLLERDRQLLAAAREQERAMEAARRRAREAAEEAEAGKARVVELVERQRAVLTEAREQQQAQEEVVAELAADRRAQAELVAELRRQLDSVEAVLTTPREVPFDQPDPAWTDRLPERGRRWAGEVDAAAARAGVDGRFLAALVWTESYFRQDAVSSAGAIGLTQLMPATAASLGVDPHDPIGNLSGGARYIRRQLEAFRDIETGLAAYNQGPGRVTASGGIPDSVGVQLYVLSVVERWRGLLE